MERKEGTFLVAFGGYNGEYSNEVGWEFFLLNGQFSFPGLHILVDNSLVLRQQFYHIILIGTVLY